MDLKKDKNTGSSVFQINILTERILYLTKHLKSHFKDNHCIMGLKKIVSKKKKIIKIFRKNR